MVTSILFINAERTRINEVAQELAGIEGISEVYSVSGKYDIIAIVRVKTNDELADLVTNQLIKIASIEKTETNLAFRTVSKHDLEAMFSIGT
ncbi:MAG: Lrp/AsnC ligand binding domain-containing protein [SAR324 cluster bacterium]|nr:Lrp/AsnC ligand binding domain-containing protein [SAR324 cluster bacterium]